MDIRLARTFLEIVGAGSFVQAARRLNVTQTAVSARIKLLEQELGRTLFIRNKSGASLTPAGEQFLRYAPTLIQLWERARHQVAVPAGHRAVLAVGGELSLWSPLLLHWLLWMRRSAADIALRMHVGVPERLIRQVVEGVIDIAVTYTPHHGPGLKVERLLEEELVLVTTDPPAGNDLGSGYVYVDWGPEFAAHHGTSFPHFSAPELVVGLGPLGLNYILEAGGSGYFRMRAVRPFLDSGRLSLVSGAPAFRYPAYAVHSAGADMSLLGPALAGLRDVAAIEFADPARET